MKYLLVLVFLSSSLLGYAEKKLTLDQAKALYAKADKELNLIYKSVKVPAHLSEEYKEDQRSWIKYRDYMAEFQASLIDRADDVKKSIAYWEMMAGLTESRGKYLQAWQGVAQDDEWSGEYTDGRGGWMVIQREGDKLKFEVSVVRGPTHHLGDVSGVAQINKFTARYAEPLNEEGNQGAWLTFKQHNTNFIKLEADNAQHLHGMRAYFDGVYIRIKKSGKFSEGER